MKVALLISSAVVFFSMFGCRSGNNENIQVVTQDTVYDYTDTLDRDSVLYVKSKALLWHVTDSNGLKIGKPDVAGIDTMSAQRVIQLVNNNYDSIHLYLVK